MTEVSEVVESTIDKVLDRVDRIAAKLGIAAREVWRFAVTAKVVEAKRDVAKYGALILVSFLLWGWAARVAVMKLPHEIKSIPYTYIVPGDRMPCDQVGVVNGKQVVLHEQCWQNKQVEKVRTEDQGVSNFGWMFLVSGIACALVGLGLAITSISGVIDGLAAAKTAEYDAYQDLIYDWKD